MKMIKRTEEQIKVELAKSPIREIGKWAQICEEVKKSKDRKSVV